MSSQNEKGERATGAGSTCHSGSFAFFILGTHVDCCLLVDKCSKDSYNVFGKYT